jgi:hypothetical protein
MKPELIKNNLLIILAELGNQPEVGGKFPPELQSYSEQVEQLREYIDAKEYGIAYESIVAMLEEFEFLLSGPVVIKLLEVGLLMRFKTNRAEDAKFSYC